MKNKILTGLLVLLSLVTFGQKVELRPSFGLNWYNFDKNISISTNYNYMLGMSLNSSGQTIYFETGCYWSGFEFNDSTKLNQLRFPMKFGVNFINKDKKHFNFRAFAGPVAYLTLEDMIVDWSANVGLGIDIYPLFVNVGYDIGITEYENIKINNFYIKAGFIFMLPTSRPPQDPNHLYGNYNP